MKKNMKNFKQIREKASSSLPLEEKNHLSFPVKDTKTSEYIKKELSGLVKAEFETEKKGSGYVLKITPSSRQDEDIVKSFMDDAKIEMLKDEFIRGFLKSSSSDESFEQRNFNDETVIIDSDQSKKIIEIHDTLDRENQEIFMEMIVHSKETFDQIVNFCETYSKK